MLLRDLGGLAVQRRGASGGSCSWVDSFPQMWMHGTDEGDYEPLRSERIYNRCLGLIREVRMHDANEGDYEPLRRRGI